MRRHVDGDDDGIGYGVGGSSDRGDGVFGRSSSGRGVYGGSDSGIGVQGYSDRYGVWGESPSGFGMYGGSDTLTGVWGDGGRSGNGVIGWSNSSYGMYGYSDSGTGVYGHSNLSYGVAGSSSKNFGMYGISSSGTGVYGHSDSGYGMRGRSYSAIGVDGYSDSYTGVRGWSYSGIGVHGYSDSGYGMYGISYNGTGVYGYSYSTSGYAAYLDGRVYIRGPLEKPGGSFKIDHPLDPANKYLCHSFVESPDMKNVYDGVVALDDKGEAEIELPDWFGALNKDCRYQLTAIGAPGPNLYIAEEISDTTTEHRSDYNNNNNSHFKIAGGTSGMKVSWQVTGIRKDPWANAHRVQVEEDKPDKERGYYIYPDLYGQPAEKEISRLLFPEQENQQLLIE